MVKRVLVTTALEDTWSKDGSPILFIGEWCKLYGRKHIWQDLDYEVAPYHWDDRGKLFEDYKDLLTIYESALSALAVKLNKIHGVGHSLRYWRILIGPWLGYFIQMLYDRWFMLDSTLKTYDVSEVNVFHRGANGMVTNDMSDFIRRFVDDDWNETIFSELILLSFRQELKVNIVHRENDLKQSESNQLSTDSQKINLSSALKKGFKRTLTYLPGKIPGKADYFFISSYLPRKIEFLLQLKLHQFPKSYFSRDVDVTDPCAESRKWSLEISDVNSIHAKFVNILSEMIPRHIPTAYLEGYLNLIGMGQQVGWPSQPKTIFTSNAYSSDDMFKAWAAEKTENGSNLMIGQHGGHLGMTPFAFHEEHQIEIADKWISWGWDDESRSHIKPVGNFKVLERNIVAKKSGRALLIQMALPRYSYHLYALPISACQYDAYFEDQKRFVSELSDEVRQQLTVRLYSNDYSLSQSLRWGDACHDVNVDNGVSPLNKLLAESRICISTYNATTYLESFALNFPTLIFWDPNYWELNSEAQPYFELLESVGILHKMPESAAMKLNEIWNNVENWWLDPKTQDAKDRFCAKFSMKVEKPVNELSRILKTVN